MNKVCVLGSMNVDLTFSVPRFTLPGESMIATNTQIFTGGKGGNQTVACARLGAEVNMIGCVGDDANGAMYLRVLKDEGVDTSGVTVTPDAPTGLASIELTTAGENRIVVGLGANYAMTPDMVTNKAEYLRAADVCLFQLENPTPVVNHGMALAREAGRVVILDPAPVPGEPLPSAIYLLCDYITPNETELSILSGMPVGTIDEAVRAAEVLIARGAKAVINKRGGDGALLVTTAGFKHFPGFKVNVVDTTAAGDSFNAGLAVGLAKGYALGDAIVLANAVGALSTTAAGAKTAMPTFDEVTAFIANASV